jgi:glycosyltransferase involved in cell wall biosynthesis
MAEPLPLAPALGRFQASAEVLQRWRLAGPEAARCEWRRQQACTAQVGPDALLEELGMRLDGQPGPRLLVDGLWFSRPQGGITRVWEQILRCWSLPGMVTTQAPVALVERNSHLALCAAFPQLEGRAVDPLDPQAVADLAADNGAWVQRWGAQVFLSSWISSSGVDQPRCPELGLVHDCLPERYGVPQPLRALRHRWLKGAQAQLAVSAATASDLEVLLSRPAGSVPWCHPAPAELFAGLASDAASERLWQRLSQRAGLQPPYLLLPATSAIGSYKNPELVAEALGNPELLHLQLVLCGIAADQRRQELEQRFPHLSGRCIAAGFTDLELALAYRQAWAVVIPSHAEGFGLPAVEAMAAGATVLVADSRGLREAGAGAALRFSSRRPAELAALLSLLGPDQPAWFSSQLAQRRQRRLAALHPDLLGLALLALARQLCP